MSKFIQRILNEPLKNVQKDEKKCNWQIFLNKGRCVFIHKGEKKSSNKRL